MPFNVLLLPLLGGYFFITNWNFTRFATKRYSGERLLFHAAAAGIVWLIVAFLAVTVLDGLWPSVRAEWRKMVPFPYAGTSLAAFLGGALGWWPLNAAARAVGFNRQHFARVAMEAWGDYLEIVIEESIQRTLPVSITLKNGKFYIGFVLQNFDPAYERKYVRVLPTDSGYREPTTHKLRFSTKYSPVLQEVVRRLDEAEAVRVHPPLVVERPSLIEPEDFQIVLPIAEIQSAGLWDWDAYEMFRQAESMPAPLPPDALPSDTGEETA